MSNCNEKTEDFSFLWIASELNTFKIIFCYSITRILNTITTKMLQLQTSELPLSNADMEKACAA